MENQILIVTCTLFLCVTSAIDAQSGAAGGVGESYHRKKIEKSALFWSATGSILAILSEFIVTDAIVCSLEKYHKKQDAIEIPVFKHDLLKTEL